MDESRRNFILGISSAYAALSVSAATGTSMMLKSKNNAIERKSIDISDWKFSSYEGFDVFLACANRLSNVFFHAQ